MTSKLRSLLLESLPADALAEVRPRLKFVTLPKRHVLYEPQELPQYAHFMTAGIASVVVETPEGTLAEVNLLGNEALVEGMHLLGPTPVLTRCFMQVAGSAFRISFKDMQ